MTIGGIDDVQAAKSGNVVLYEGGRKILVDGATGKLIADIPADAEVAKQEAIAATGKQVATRGKYRDTRYGNCGYSYMYIEDASGGNNYRFLTGFEVYGNAYDFGWETSVTAPGFGSSWSDYGPQTPGPRWTSNWRTDDTSSPGYTHYAQVDSGSAAFLTDGSVCYSGLPRDTAVVW